MITEIGIIGEEVEAEVEAEAWTGLIMIGVEEKGRGKETIVGEAGASVLGGLVLIIPRGGEEDATLTSVEAAAVAVAVAIAIAKVVAVVVVVLWIGC